MSEHLARFRMTNGETIEMDRQDGDVSIKAGGSRVRIPNATGQQTLDLCSLFESLGGSAEYPEEGGET